MFAYTVLLITLVFVIIMAHYLRKIKRHDTTLYQFCQQRRDLIKLLRNNGEKLSDADYSIAINLQNYLDDTIHNFANYIKVFNIYKLGKNLKEAVVKIEKMQKSDRKDLQKMQNDFMHIQFIAFFRFTPFLKYRLIVTILLLLCQILISFGLNRIFSWICKTNGFLTWLKNEEHQCQERVNAI
ncbi:MAG: hypothetical protein KAS17_08875 [Victivallaceae bacterium]|nr:hypothetical protein [Victivallaceae bacterium]